ncbi:endonuclease/exonuclease/phosphatase family protein [Amycolatopsis sp. 195334CR]|uniref:endonuclease/exonuclease/phosphatase family protein n=1 Tax=Amycolatopsis sp. 195334CR TaxID=2814588 RepID=UPI001A9050B0|nr:endonuclease/exonuclease/phosphatase family protein [Amycolatopsis sp. 195334CR]MBN6039828.1 endonuclease/exonuclease/phosphatase family protein [Amycolatopsis sp. 195334CR]
MRILTFNALAPEFADWPRRREVLADGIRALSPDLITVQEVDDEIVDLLGPGWHFAWHSGRDESGVGAVAVSRWPLGAVRELDQRPPGREIRTAWCATVAVEVHAPSPLWLVHHKPSWPYGYEVERERQAVAAARFVERLVPDPATPVVLAGDFDAEPDSASVRFWTGKQSLDGTSTCYADAWRGGAGHTFSPENPLVRAGDMPGEAGRRIDYVMQRAGPHGPPFAVVDCRRVFTEPVGGVQASDHYGVFAEFTALPHAPGDLRTLRAGADTS